MADAVTWTDERVEQLKKLWIDGLSASQIAGELGNVTRNAVIGKVHRLGLSGRAKSNTSATPRPRKPAAPRAPVAASASRSAAAVALKPIPVPQRLPEPLPNPEVVIPFSERVTIMELRESMCRWPLGDPTTAEFRFCGTKVRDGAPYCPYHCQIAYQPAADRRRDRERKAVAR
jgi:GcrA cell cycle regulator